MRMHGPRGSGGAVVGPDMEPGHWVEVWCTSAWLAGLGPAVMHIHLALGISAAVVQICRTWEDHCCALSSAGVRG